MLYKENVFYEQCHPIPQQRMKNKIFPHTFWRPLLDSMPQLFLDSNMCGFQFIWRVLWSQVLVVNWQNQLFISPPPEYICIVTKSYLGSVSKWAQRGYLHAVCICLCNPGTSFDRCNWIHTGTVGDWPVSTTTTSNGTEWRRKHVFIRIIRYEAKFWGLKQH